MADRYWVGGTGTWGSTQTTNWSAATGLSFTASCTGTVLTTTGSPALAVGMTVWANNHTSLGTISSGANPTWTVSVGGTFTLQDMSAATVGASVPTGSDNVFFDANSNSGTTAFTCTMANTPRVCADFTASGLDGTMTLAGSSIGLTVFSSLTFQATNFTRTYSGTTTFSATTTGKTVTTNGVAFGGAIVFNGVGGGWTLGSALTTSSTLTVTNGTFDTSSSGNYSVSADSLSSNNSNLRTINLNASSITLSTNGTVWNASTTTNLTVTGTGTISLTSIFAKTFAGGSFSYSGITINQGGGGALTITGSNTFNDITNTRKNTGAATILFVAGATNTFTNWNASGASTRLLTIGSTTAASHTLSKASGTVSADFLSVSQSTATGGAGWYAGANSTNGGNNSGWIFTAPPAPSGSNSNFLMFF